MIRDPSITVLAPISRLVLRDRMLRVSLVTKEPMIAAAGGIPTISTWQTAGENVTPQCVTQILLLMFEVWLRQHPRNIPARAIMSDAEKVEQ